jgi:hypothetical protein
MPRCGIVKLSTIQKHGGRWDAAYYLGRVDRQPIELARKQLLEAQSRLDRRSEEIRIVEERSAEMIADGDVTIIGDKA